MREMDKYEKAIREKVFASNLLTPGEWVYLVGLFSLANDEWGPAEFERIEAENKRLRSAAKRLVEEADSTVITDAAGQRHQKVFVKNLAALADAYQQPRPSADPHYCE